MKIINRYLVWQMIAFTAIVLCVFVGINLFVYFAAELNDIGKGSYTLIQALYYVLLQAPYMAYQLLPMAALMGVLLGLGQLANTNQILAMRAAGYSIRQALVAVLQATVIMLIVMLVVGEYFAPGLLQKSQDLKSRDMGQLVQQSALQNVWLRSGTDFIYVQTIQSNTQLSNIRLYRFNDDKQLMSIIIAPSAVKTNAGWQLQQAQETTFFPKKIDSKLIGQMVVNANIRPQLISEQNIAPEQLDLKSLRQMVRYRETAGLSYTSLDYAFWVRIFGPVTLFVMMSFALPFIFNVAQRTASMGQRVVIGVLIGFGFYMLNQFLGLFSMVFQIPPFAAAAFPTVLFAGILVWLLARV